MEATWFLSNGDKIKHGLWVQELLDASLSCDALNILKIPGHSKLDSLHAKGNDLVDISAKNAVFKGISSFKTTVMVQRGISPTDSLENWPEMPKKWPQKSENNVIYPAIVGLIRGESSGLDQITIHFYQN